MGRLHISIAGMMVLVLVLSIGFASLRFPSEPLAGTVLLLTLGAFALAVLAVVYRRGERRAFWLGFALFGWGYMALTAAAWWDHGADRPTLITSLILDDIASPYLLSDGSPRVAPSLLENLMGRNKSKKILAALEEPISMSFANETPLEDVLKYIKAASQGPNWTGIQIYVDPVGLNAAEKTMTSPVTLDVEGVPLKTTLRLLLNQLGLTYSVRDGLLMITKEAVADPFRRIGHCYWALLLAWLGGLAGRALHNTSARDSIPG
jgi:hypothetical protein